MYTNFLLTSDPPSPYAIPWSRHVWVCHNPTSVTAVLNNCTQHMDQMALTVRRRTH